MRAEKPRPVDLISLGFVACGLRSLSGFPAFDKATVATGPVKKPCLRFGLALTKPARLMLAGENMPGPGWLPVQKSCPLFRDPRDRYPYPVDVLRRSGALYGENTEVFPVFNAAASESGYSFYLYIWRRLLRTFGSDPTLGVWRLLPLVSI